MNELRYQQITAHLLKPNHETGEMIPRKGVIKVLKIATWDCPQCGRLESKNPWVTLALNCAKCPRCMSEIEQPKTIYGKIQ